MILAQRMKYLTQVNTLQFGRVIKSTMDFSCAIFALELAKSCKIRSFLLQMKNLRKDEKAQHLQDVMIDMVMSFEFCKLRILKKTSLAQL